MNLFISLLVLSVFISGISLNSANVTHILALTTSALGLFGVYKSSSKVKYPPNFLWMIIFLFILQISVIFTRNKLLPFYFLLTFIEAVSFWLIFFNSKVDLSKKIRQIIIGLSLLYSSFYFLSKYTVLNLTQYMQYFYNLIPGPAHQHLGDLWSIGMILGINNLPLFILGSFFLIISHSRSAVLSLFIGLMYVFYKNLSKINKNLIYLFVAIGILIFIFTGFYKTIFFSRPYYLQSLVGIFYYPLGTGMGNFSEISNSIGMKYEYLYAPTTYVLNIVLETLSAVGIFCIPFVIWLFLTVKDVIKRNNRLWTGVFLAITLNFMFDYTYSIPLMIWLWFISLGIAQREG